MESRLYFIHALSPLHAGTGQGIDAIDLPIAREKATRLPILPGSSIKGVLRAASRDENVTNQVFGSSNTDYAGSLSVADACLLMLPVRSLSGTFAWVTSPYVMRRLQRDLAVVGETGPGEIPVGGEEEVCLVANEGCALLVEFNGGHKVYLEDLDLIPAGSEIASAWARWIALQIFPDDEIWQQTFIARFCLVHDDVFSFLLDTAMEITARISLKEDTKTVTDGGLWYEESLPTESILWGMVAALPVKAEPELVFSTLGSVTQNVVQLGGNATVGRGLCRIHLGKGQ